jgi:hypothetical protein
MTKNSLTFFYLPTMFSKIVKRVTVESFSCCPRHVFFFFFMSDILHLQFYSDRTQASVSVTHWRLARNCSKGYQNPQQLGQLFHNETISEPTQTHKLNVTQNKMSFNVSFYSILQFSKVSPYSVLRRKCWRVETSTENNRQRGEQKIWLTEKHP